MPGISELSTLFLLGLLGSAHCVGMCGGFAFLARGPGRMLGYALGKTAMYTALGAAAGAVGHVLLEIQGIQKTLGLLVGLFLLVVGAGAAGLIPDRVLVPSSLMDRLGPLLGKATRATRAWGGLGLGLVNGLLPCGLVYAALMQATVSGSGGEGAVLMAAFGAGTLPALLTVSILGGRLPAHWRGRLVRVGGWLVIGMGLITILRTVGGMTPHLM